MPNIFGSASGRIALVNSDDGTIPLGLICGDLKDTVGFKGILTGLSLSGQSGYQVMHTLRQYIYVYTFGERIGEIVISGLAVVADCGDIPDLNSPTGLARVFNWYERNRISAIGRPISITCTPTLVLNGFLVNFKYQVVDPSISLGQFALSFFYPPRIKVPAISVGGTPTLRQKIASPSNVSTPGTITSPTITEPSAGIVTPSTVTP